MADEAGANWAALVNVFGPEVLMDVSFISKKVNWHANQLNS